MKTANGNDKLGKENCIVVSRAVGDTCPPDCDFLDILCVCVFNANLDQTSSLIRENA